jgi:hypothetical protein
MAARDLMARFPKVLDGTVGAVRIGFDDQYAHACDLLKQWLDVVERFDGP